VIRRDVAKTLPDEELIRHIKDGDEGLFSVLVERYQDLVAGIVISMIGRCAEAEDLGQEIFIRLYRGLPNFRQEATLKTYISRIAINICYDELRRRKQERYISEVKTEAKDMPAEAVNPEIGTDIGKSIEFALEQLDSVQRSVVIMRLSEGFSVKETAVILGLPEGTVLSKLYRAQLKLREILKKDLY